MAKNSPIYREEAGCVSTDSCAAQRRAITEGKILFQGVSHGVYPGQRLNHADLPGLSGAGHWETRGPQDWGVPEHRNEGVELCWCESGENLLGVGDVVHRLTPAVVSVTRPWEPHRLGAPHIGEGRLHWLILDVGVRRPNEAWRWPAWVVLTPPDREALGRLLWRYADLTLFPCTAGQAEAFRELADCVTGIGSAGVTSRLAIAVNRVLWHLLESLRLVPESAMPAADEFAAEDPNRRTVRLYWEDFARRTPEPAHRPTVPDMAAECGMGVTAFILHTKAVTGSTPAAFLGERRVVRAAAMLRESRLTVSEIAAACGFASSHYFATRFGERFGCTPGDYRKR